MSNRERIAWWLVVWFLTTALKILAQELWPGSIPIQSGISTMLGLFTGWCFWGGRK